MSIEQALENSYQITRAFLQGEPTTLHIRIDHWEGVLSWLIPAGDVAKVQTLDDEHYRITFVTSYATRRRWGFADQLERKGTR